MNLYPGLSDDDHVKSLGDAEWQRVGDLRAAVAKEFEPPNPYERDVIRLRAASATDLSRFEDSYKAQRLRDLEATRAALDAHIAEHPVEPLTDEEVKQYRAPDSYAAGIRALQERKQ
jgi:hypothetical protein